MPFEKKPRYPFEGVIADVDSGTHDGRSFIGLKMTQATVFQEASHKAEASIWPGWEETELDAALVAACVVGAKVKGEYVLGKGNRARIDSMEIVEQPQAGAPAPVAATANGRHEWKDTSPSIERQKALAEARQTVADCVQAEGMPTEQYAQVVLTVADIYDAWLARGREATTTPVPAPTSACGGVSEAEVAQEPLPVPKLDRGGCMNLILQYWNRCGLSMPDGLADMARAVGRTEELKTLTQATDLELRGYVEQTGAAQ